MNKKILRKRKGKWITLSATVIAAVSGASLSNDIETIHAQEVAPVIEENELQLYEEEMPADTQAPIVSEEVVHPEEEVAEPVEEPVVPEPAPIEESIPTTNEEVIYTEETVTEAVPQNTEETSNMNEEVVPEAVSPESIPNEISPEEIIESPVVQESSEVENVEDISAVESGEDTATPEQAPTETNLTEEIVDETETVVDAESLQTPVEEVIETEPVSEVVQDQFVEPTLEESADSVQVVEEVAPEEPVQEFTEDLVENPDSDVVAEDASIEETTANSTVPTDTEDVNEANDFEEQATEDVTIAEETDAASESEAPVENGADQSEEQTVTDNELVDEEATTVEESEVAPISDTNDTESVIEDVEDEATLSQDLQEESVEGSTQETSDEDVEQNSVEETVEEPATEVVSDSVDDEAEQKQIERYTVSRGDTLYSISQRTGVSVKDLQEMNNLTSNIIHPTTDLIVAQSTNVTSTKDDQRRKDTAKNVTVNSGDTLYSLAKRHNVSVSDLRDWNGLTSDAVYSNQSLVLSNPNSSDSIQEKTETVATNYAVQSGDTLYTIANRHQVSIDDLMEWNQLTSNNISINQQLVVSQDTETEAETPTNEAYSVRQGDTLYSIAQRNGITVSQLIEWNDITNNTIVVNQQLTVSNQTDDTENENDSTNEEENQESENYTIQRGDTLYSIARRNNVSVAQLREWNNLANDTIHLNQAIIVNQGGNEATDPDDSDSSEDVEFVTDSEAKSEFIQWFKDREGNTTYSMTNRNGPTSYDCSSAVFSALIHAGYLPEGTWLGNTETLYGLEGSLLIPISADEVTAGDIFVNGIKGNSLGSGGHTGVALSNDTIIHSNYRDNGISTTPISGRTGSGPTYWYRLNEALVQA